jgi:hypothetical protein
MELPEAYFRGPPLSHLRTYSSYPATIGWMSRPAELALTGILLLACLALLDEVAPCPSIDEVRFYDDDLLGIRMKHRVVVVDMGGALAFIYHVRYRKAVLGILETPIVVFQNMFFFFLFAGVSPNAFPIFLL